MKIFANYTNKSIKKIYYFDLAPLQGTNKLKLDLFFLQQRKKKKYLSLHVVVKFKIIFCKFGWIFFFFITMLLRDREFYYSYFICSLR